MDFLGDDEGDDGKFFLDKVDDLVKGFWDWFFGKVLYWWDKVFNGSDGESEEFFENFNE